MHRGLSLQAVLAAGREGPDERGLRGGKRPANQILQKGSKKDTSILNRSVSENVLLYQNDHHDIVSFSAFAMRVCGSLPSFQRIEPIDELLRGRQNDDLYDLIMSLLKYEPERRLTATEALKHRFFGDSNSSPNRTS